MSRSFKDLIAFQRAMDLLVLVYEVTGTFPRREAYGFVSQLQRAAGGVISQIAEGSGRLTYGEWRQFLSQARGSLFEVEAQCMAANRLGFLETHEHARVQRQITQTARTLAGLIRWVRSKERKHRQPTTENRQPINAATPAGSRNHQGGRPQRKRPQS
jgi:four helix bundle protein